MNCKSYKSHFDLRVRIWQKLLYVIQTFSLQTEKKVVLRLMRYLAASLSIFFDIFILKNRLTFAQNKTQKITFEIKSNWVTKNEALWKMEASKWAKNDERS